MLTTTSFSTFQAFPGTFFPGIVSGIALNHDTLFLLLSYKQLHRKLLEQLQLFLLLRILSAQVLVL